MILKIRGQQEPLATGEYPARLVGVYDETHEKFGVRLRWEFEIVRGEHTGRRLQCYTGTSTGLKSKIRPWLQALLGRPLSDNEDIDTDTLVGKYCILSVHRKMREDGSETNIVADVLPPRRLSTPPPAPQPAPDHADYDDITLEGEDDPFA